MPDLVALVWFAINVFDPTKVAGPMFSEKLFDTHQECKDAVSYIAGSKDIFVNENDFRFGVTDGIVFVGGCVTASEYENKMKDYPQ